MRDFRTLTVWQKAHRLTLSVYEATRRFPKEELYGLVVQVRRAAASIPTNIAEGCGRQGDREFRRFLRFAAGSASEVEYHLLLAHDLQYIDLQDYNALNRDVCEVKRMLSGLIRTMKVEG